MTRPRTTTGEELLKRIPEPWHGATMSVAEVLRAAGHRAWIVGGAVRDLVLERPLKDVDLVSGALPDEVESLFPKTVAVGKAFGIIVVVQDGLEIEVATFREERGYSDRRRPDEVVFADRPEIDARRRDFTCNALYLDPLSGEMVDPSGGAKDLRGGVLRTVGEPGARFREDGLRLLRMARFLARFAMRPAPGLLDAARAEGGSLEGVAPERVLDELQKICRGPAAGRALGILDVADLARRVVPGWGARNGGAPGRVSALEALESWHRAEPGWAAPGSDSGSPSASDPGGGPESGGDALFIARMAVCLGGLLDSDESDQQRTSLLGSAASLRAPKALGQRLTALLDWLGALPGTDIHGQGPPGLATVTPEEQRGMAVEAWRAAERPAAALYARASHEVQGEPFRTQRLMAYLTAAEASAVSAPPESLPITAKALIGAGWSPGPELGAILARTKRAYLGGAFTNLDGAIAWAKARSDD